MQADKEPTASVQALDAKMDDLEDMINNAKYCKGEDIMQHVQTIEMPSYIL